MGMKGRRLIVGCVVAGAALAAVLARPFSAAAQTPSLGEVARKEAERRKAQPPSGKVYTNKDLPPSAQKPATPTPSTAAGTETTIPLDPVAAATGDQAAKPDGGAAPEDGTGKAEKTEAWWRARITTAREDLRRKEMFAEALQTRINSLTRDFTSRDNPAQRAEIGRDRTEALTELAKVKTEIQQGKQQIADIEEEARKSSVPPGWLR
jgi:hypothetical protein